MLDRLVLSYIHLTSVINYQFHSFTTSYSSFVALSGFSGFFFDFLIYLIFRHIKSHVDKVFRNDCTCRYVLETEKKKSVSDMW